MPDWIVVAKQFGLSSERELLEHLYLDQQQSIEEIATRLGCQRFAVFHKLDQLKIPRRGRGGNNSHNPQSYKLFHLDQRALYFQYNQHNLKELSAKICVSSSLLYKYCKRRVGYGILHYLTDCGIEALCDLKPSAPSPSSSTE